MRKILCLFFSLLCIITGFGGCNSLNEQPATLAESITIPKDGVIEASVFSSLKRENKTVTFNGTSGGIHYKWVIFGSDIKEGKDLNLGIEITKADEKEVAFRFLSKENFGFSPTLSIYLKDFWDAKDASVCAEEATEATKAQSVSITGKKQSILNFSPKVQTGAFVITPNIESDDINASTPQGSEAEADNASSENPNPDDKGSELQESKRPVSDGKGTKQDQYKTDPVPEGKPLPAEPENQTIDMKKAYTCTFSIECSTIFNNLGDLEEGKLDVLPKDGVILSSRTVTFYEGESVYDVLQRVCREHGIQMEASWTPMYNSAYVEGIHNLYEFDCGNGSGWMYRVNGWYPNYGCSRYQLKQGETVEWRYTCDLGADIGGGYAIGE